MRIFITGATGFIGKATVIYLQGKGHSITTLVRDKNRAINILGKDVSILGVDTKIKDLVNELESCDAVINLSGIPLAGVRWTKKKKHEFYDSRVNLTNIISDAINQCQSPPKVLISASAVGYYGDKNCTQLDETSPMGQGFLPELCEEWEKAAIRSEDSGTRVCLLRLGIVLGREGGIISKITPAFTTGIGAYIGNGNEMVSWIHQVDVLKIIDLCLKNPSINGPINCTTSTPVTSKEFAKAIQKSTNSKILIRIPKVFLKILLKEGADVLTNSHNVVPDKLTAIGYKFKYPYLPEALNTEFQNSDVIIQENKYQHSPDSGNGNLSHLKNLGQYKLSTITSLNSDSETVFDFFSSPVNLGIATPTWMELQLLSMPGQMKPGEQITYKIRLWLIYIKWVTEILIWEPHKLFADYQKYGPFKLWLHEHKITSIQSNVAVMEDTVIYSIRGGVLGKIIHKLLIKNTLTRIFIYRKKVIEMRFGKKID